MLYSLVSLLRSPLFHHKQGNLEFTFIYYNDLYNQVFITWFLCATEDDVITRPFSTQPSCTCTCTFILLAADAQNQCYQLLPQMIDYNTHRYMYNVMELMYS